MSSFDRKIVTAKSSKKIFYVLINLPYGVNMLYIVLKTTYHINHYFTVKFLLFRICVCILFTNSTLYFNGFYIILSNIFTCTSHLFL